MAILHRMEQAKATKRDFEELSDDDRLSAVHISTDEFRTSNAKRGRFEEKGPTRIGGNVNEVLHISKQSAQAFPGQLPLKEPSSRGVSRAAGGLGSLSKKERIAADFAQARSTLARAIQRLELKLKANESTLIQNKRPNNSRLLQGERKTSPSGRDGDSLPKETGHATTQESDRVFAEDKQLSNPQMLLISQAAALRVNRDRVILVHNNSQPKSITSTHIPQSAQIMHGSQKYTIKSLHLFLTTVTEAWYGASVQTHRDNICKELQTQQSYIWEILSTHRDSRSLSIDAQATLLSRIATQMLVEFEKTWAENHPEVAVPAIQNVLHRQIAYLAMDVAIKCGHVAHLDEASLLSHITAVQTEAKSRQLIILKALTESLRQKAQSIRLVVAPVQDQKTTLASSVNPLSKQVSLVRDGLSEPAAQDYVLVVDEVTGVASVVQEVHLRIHAAPRSTAGPQMKSLKRKQETQTSLTRKRLKKAHARQGAGVLTSREQTMALQSLIQNTAARGGSEKRYNDVENLFHTAERAVQPHGTVNPTKLLKNFSVSSIITCTSKPVSNTPAANGRRFMDVMEVFQAHGKNVVSGEDRTRHLLRHREANKAFLGERSPTVLAGMESVGVNDFFYVTPVDFDGFEFED